MAKKSNSNSKKVMYDITTGTKVEQDEPVEQPVQPVESEQTDVNKLIDKELEDLYPEHVKYPTSTGLLQCILRELIRQRIGR